MTFFAFFGPFAVYVAGLVLLVLGGPLILGIALTVGGALTFVGANVWMGMRS